MPVVAATVVSLQEPGRNLELISPGPHFQSLIVPVPATMVGTKNMVLPSIAGSPKPVAVTRIAPFSLVETFATYFDVDVEDSQPQPPPAGKEAALLDWTVSVMLVRQADAARTTSDILARLV